MSVGRCFMSQKSVRSANRNRVCPHAAARVADASDLLPNVLQHAAQTSESSSPIARVPIVCVQILGPQLPTHRPRSPQSLNA